MIFRLIERDFEGNCLVMIFRGCFGSFREGNCLIFDLWGFINREMALLVSLRPLEES